MVARDVAEAVVALISCESESLSRISDEFEKCGSKADQLSILTSLASLMLADVLDSTQQIVTVWLLYMSFGKFPAKASPFYEVLQFIWQSGGSTSNSYSQKLCDVIGCLFSERGELTDKSVHEIFEGDYSVEAMAGREFISGLSAQVTHLSPIIVSRPGSNESHLTQHQLLRELLVDPVCWSDFVIPFNRQTPAVCTPTDEEMQFMHIDSAESPPFLMDVESSINAREVAKMFVRQGVDRQLREMETEIVMGEMKQSARLCAELKLDDGQIDRLLGKNPQIGAVFVREAARGDVSKLKALEKGDVTAASVAVVKEVVLNLDIPEKFVGRYVANAVELIHGTRDGNALKAKGALFCHLISDLSKGGVQFDGNAVLDLNMIYTELAKKNLPEAVLIKTLAEGGQ